MLAGCGAGDFRGASALIAPVRAPQEKKRARSSATSSRSSSSSTSSRAVAPSESSGSDSDAWSAPESEDALNCAQFAHGAEQRDKIHLLEDDGSLPWCAHDVAIEPDGYGIGWSQMRERGRRVCGHCCKRFSTTPDVIAERLRAEG